MIRISTSKAGTVEIAVLLSDTEAELDGVAATLGAVYRVAYYGVPCYRLTDAERIQAIADGIAEATPAEIEAIKAVYE